MVSRTPGVKPVMKSESFTALFRKTLSVNSSLMVNVGKKTSGPRIGTSGKNVISGMTPGVVWAEARDVLIHRLSVIRLSVIARAVSERARSTARYVPQRVATAKGLFLKPSAYRGDAALADSA